MQPFIPRVKHSNEFTKPLNLQHSEEITINQRQKKWEARCKLLPIQVKVNKKQWIDVTRKQTKRQMNKQINVR